MMGSKSPFEKSDTCTYGCRGCGKLLNVFIERQVVDKGELVTVTACSCVNCSDKMRAVVERWSPDVPKEIEGKILSWKRKSSFTCTLATPHMLLGEDEKYYVGVRDVKTKSLKRLPLIELMNQNRGLPDEAKFLEPEWFVSRRVTFSE